MTGHGRNRLPRSPNTDRTTAADRFLSTGTARNRTADPSAPRNHADTKMYDASPGARKGDVSGHHPVARTAEEGAPRTVTVSSRTPRPAWPTHVARPAVGRANLSTRPREPARVGRETFRQKKFQRPAGRRRELRCVRSTPAGLRIFRSVLLIGRVCTRTGATRTRIIIITR